MSRHAEWITCQERCRRSPPSPEGVLPTGDRCSLTGGLTGTMVTSMSFNSRLHLALSFRYLTSNQSISQGSSGSSPPPPTLASHYLHGFRPSSSSRCSSFLPLLHLINNVPSRYLSEPTASELAPPQITGSGRRIPRNHSPALPSPPSPRPSLIPAPIRRRVSLSSQVILYPSLQMQHDRFQNILS